jgi:glycosyltransferase involved in cell wall biosynthesis
VYNTGEHIEACIASLLRQSLPASEYEVIFVDDGSTDATPARLDEVAAAHPNVTVIHTPNSGWPGRPRNIGIDKARGEYVQFVDHDDWLGDEALERLYDYAKKNDADVVIGKMAGHGRGIPKELFRHNRPDAKLGQDPLLTILTPHKMFRKAMLDRNGIRFPEGKRRLEDHLFVMQCYFAARRISVLADYVCYHWFRHGANASSVRADAKVYFDSLRDVLDVVEANTEPGEFRDDLLRHWYRGKMLGTLTGRSLLAIPEPQRTETFEEIRRLAQERFGPAVPGRLGGLQRVRSALLLAGRLDLLVELARWEAGLTPVGELLGASWQHGALLLRYVVTLVDADGQPVPFVVRHGRPHWRLPAAIEASGLVPDSATAVPKALPRTRAELMVRSSETGAELMLPGTTRWRPGRGSQRYMRFVGQATLDPATLAGSGPLAPGEWFLQVSLRGCGLARTEPFPGGRGTEPLTLTVPPDGGVPVSADPRFRAALTRSTRPGVDRLLLDPRYRRVEGRVRRLDRAARRRLARGARRARRLAGRARRAVRPAPPG